MALASAGWKLGLLALLTLTGWAQAGCSQYRPFDTESDLRQRFETRLGAERAASVAIPSQLDDAIQGVVDARVSPAGGEQDRVDAIQDFIFADLGLQYALTPTRDAVSTFQTRQGNCLSFVNLFVGIARYRRLNPFYVEVEDYQRWSYREGMVVSQGHIVAGMFVDGKLSTFDFLPYQPKSYRAFQPLDEVTAIAHYYNNLGAEALLAGDTDTAERLLGLAVGLAPDFVKSVNNYAVCLLRRNQVEAAVEMLERSLATHPEDVALLTNLARAYLRQGRDQEARQLLSKMEGLHDTNPFYFVYRGELALARGELEAALELMRKAYQLESESPKVHVGLAKIYVALGDLERARHHVERALKLDATDPEAREHAVLLQKAGAAVKDAAVKEPR